MGEVIKLPRRKRDQEIADAFEAFRSAWDEAERHPNIHTYRAAVATYDYYKLLTDEEASYGSHPHH